MARHGVLSGNQLRCLPKVSFGLNVHYTIPNEINQDACNFFGRLGVYEDHGGIVLSSEEGQAIAKALGPDNIACILQNHG
jgi:hypothetical protein